MNAEPHEWAGDDESDDECRDCRSKSRANVPGHPGVWVRAHFMEHHRACESNRDWRHRERDEHARDSDERAGAPDGLPIDDGCRSTHMLIQ